MVSTAIEVVPRPPAQVVDSFSALLRQETSLQAEVVVVDPSSSHMLKLIVVLGAILPWIVILAVKSTELTQLLIEAPLRGQFL